MHLKQNSCLQERSTTVFLVESLSRQMVHRISFIMICNDVYTKAVLKICLLGFLLNIALDFDLAVAASVSFLVFLGSSLLLLLFVGDRLFLGEVRLFEVDGRIFVFEYGD